MSKLGRFCGEVWPSFLCSAPPPEAPLSAMTSSPDSLSNDCFIILCFVSIRHFICILAEMEYSKMYKDERCLICDESGNLGKDGRYFIIACIDTVECKSLHNVMKNKLKQIKSAHPTLSGCGHEIKAYGAFPSVKEQVLEAIARKNLTISYVVADKQHIEEKLIKDKNILYNYLMKLLLDKLITEADKNSKINIIRDDISTKAGSKNSFREYISIHFNYELQYNLDLNIEYKNSGSGDAYIIQAADYVANALYTQYEHNKGNYAAIIEGKQNINILFPH
jgi:hypothetical protein